MRMFFLSMLLMIIFTFTGISFADEKAECLNSCANDKRANDMYCPPAGGYTDEENKQCMAKNSTDLINCQKNCDPPAPPPEEQQPAPTDLPAETPNDPVATDNFQ